jgi:DNA-binding beta-propeller fold protein YncE
MSTTTDVSLIPALDDCAARPVLFRGVALPFRHVVTALLIALALGGVAATAAQAAPYVAAGSFAADKFNRPQRVAVERSTGRVFVADGENDRVVVFAPTGAGGDQIAEFANLEVDNPVGIAIDQSNGDVYVADAGNQRIARYVNAGGALPSYSADAGYTSPVQGVGTGEIVSFNASIAIDPITRDLLVADPGANLVKRYDSTGAYQGGDVDGAGSAGGTFTGLLDIAVDSTGDLLIIDANGDIAYGGGTSRVERFSSDGTSEGSIGATDTPSGIAVVPGTDQVVVASNQSSYTTIQSLRVTVFDPDGSTIAEIDLPAATLFGRITGIAVAADAFRRIYAVTDRDVPTNLYGTVAIQRLALDIRPEATTDAPGAIGARGSTVSGSVDPNGAPATWQVEYRQQGETEWLSAPNAPADIGAGDTAVALTRQLTDLRPNTNYEWRIVARNQLFSAVTPGTGFRTANSAPRVQTLPASDRTTTSLRLNAVVDPYGQATTYYIEYGYDAGYGTGIPAGRDGDAGSAAHPTRYSKVLTNLVPGRDLHYRVVATNASGTTYGQDRTAAPVATARGYELASPAIKNGGAPSANTTIKAAPGGGAVQFSSSQGFADAEGVLVDNGYIARRTGDAWSTRALALPQKTEHGIAQQTTTDSAIDLHAALGISARALAPGAIEGDDIGSYYVQNFETGEVSYVASANYVALSNGTGSPFLGASDDFRHVFFRTNLTNHPGVPETLPTTVLGEIWEFADGELRLVTRKADGTPFEAGSTFPAVIEPEPRSGLSMASNAISADGRRFYFSAKENPGDPDGSPTDVYLREDAERTINVSYSRRADTAGENHIAEYVGGRSDGGVVYFVDTAALAADSVRPGDRPFRLYRWTRATESLTELVVGAQHDATSNPTRFQVLRVSKDGHRVYFTLDRGLTDTKAGRTHLYMWDAEHGTTLITSAYDAEAETVTWAAMVNSLSPDGTKFAFQAGAKLTDYDNLNPRCNYDPYASSGEGLPGRCRAVYLYDATADTLRCVSCDPDGSRPGGDAYLGGALGDAKPLTHSHYEPRAVDDAGRVFFNSPDRLVPEDSDGRLDVYRWDAGELELVSPGTRSDTSFADASADGRDAFILTPDSLVVSDIDGSNDIYDARIGGGLASQAGAVVPSPCVGDGCQQKSPPSAAPADAPTNAERGQEPAVRPRQSLTFKGLTSRQRASLASGETVKLSIRLARSARISIKLRARIDAKSVTFATATRLGVAGSNSVSIKLSSPARRLLAARRKAAVTLTVGVEGVRQPRVQTFVLTRTKRSTSNRTSSRVRAAASLHHTNLDSGN